MLWAVGANPSIPVSLPNFNATAYAQWAVDDSANPLGVVMSEARRIEVR